ncbi:MAG: hemolysin family protein [Intestinibacter bartlettii]|uniref:hemolysin family protein n=1 Tax=Intestinibacter bartlettii TaxID=261299 RepID=UPI0026F2DBAC|nr:hemolysin family protein [Intestinibacter bartlettii]MDO5010432.1 hemolysin family protein [Intestinibacter bartlettii]
MQISVLLISILVLTIINIFFVECRYSLSRIDEKVLEEIEKQGNLSANRCKKIKEKEKEFLSVCQFGIIISVITIGFILSKVYKFILIEFKLTDSITERIIAVSIILIVGILEAIIGFYIPRGLAAKKPKKIMLRNSLLLRLFYAILRPFSVIVDFVSDKVCKIFRGGDFTVLDKESLQQDKFSLEDENEEIDEYNIDKKRFMDNIFSFEEKQIREVLVPRTDMVCISLDDNEDYIFNLIRKEGYTRYPVCGKDKDDLRGFIHIRDLYNQKLLENKIDISKILRKITYVSENELTSRVLEKLRKDRVQMAIVVDEYGGTSGIITVEDILEEIVGEIQDEFDEDEELDIKKLNDGSYVVQGTATITEINKELNIEIEKDGFDSIGGWMFFMLGMDIEVNQSVDFSGYRFRVIELDKFRVVSIKIEKLEKTTSEK